jgi:hypothetical protein
MSGTTRCDEIIRLIDEVLTGYESPQSSAKCWSPHVPAEARQVGAG